MRRVEHFSPSHIETIKKNFPNIDINNEWLSEKWSDELINQAKKIEYKVFSKDSFSEYIDRSIDIKYFWSFLSCKNSLGRFFYKFYF